MTVLNNVNVGRLEQVVAELLSHPEQSAELMRELEEFGILERCIRLSKGDEL